MASGAATKPKKQTSGFVKSYLIGYNVVETVGWAYLLFLLINFHLSPTKSPSLFDRIKWALIVFQNAAILEVVHALIRIVPSNPVITAMQVSSRVVVVCGVMLATRAARESIGLDLALAAWAITEIIRYGNYALNLAGGVPYIITWLRYTTFIVLYPVGVTGELLCLYAAQNEVSQTKIFTIEMPNRLNFIFNYQMILWVVMFLYLPLFPQLYLHMWSLRRKVLGGTKQKKDK